MLCIEKIVTGAIDPHIAAVSQESGYVLYAVMI
jgi:hypothetical protein